MEATRKGTADLRSASRRSAKPAPLTLRPSNVRATRQRPDHRDAGERSLPGSFPFRPRLQGGDRDDTAWLTSRTAGSKKRSPGFWRDGAHSLKSPICAGFPPRPTSRSGSSAWSASPQGHLERDVANPLPRALHQAALAVLRTARQGTAGLQTGIASRRLTKRTRSRATNLAGGAGT